MPKIRIKNNKKEWTAHNNFADECKHKFRKDKKNSKLMVCYNCGLNTFTPEKYGK